MELKDFISETIKQITDGILEGNSYVKEKSKSSKGIEEQYTKIKFDIAITTNEENKDNLGGKLSVVQVFSAGTSSSQSASTSNENRINFNISIHIQPS